MSDKKRYREGQILKMERLRQGKGIKEVADNICSVSTLSKIERGKQNIDSGMLVDLYKRLGIDYEKDEGLIKELDEIIQEYFYERVFKFQPKAFEKLKVYDEKLSYSPLSLEWMIIKGLEYHENSILEILDKCTAFMDERLLAWYYLIPRFENKNIALEKRINAQKILQNSYATLELMWQYWGMGEYGKVTSLSSNAMNYAIDEGNTWTISQVYIIRGSIYSCYNMEELMLEEYQKAMNLLKNTNWLEELEIMYYNIGATYISLHNYEKAREYLESCKSDTFSIAHKMAILETKTGNVEEANKWIEKMENHIKGYKKERKNIQWNDYEESFYNEMIKISKITRLQAVGNPYESEEYIPLLESLMTKFLKEGRYGYMIFHKESLKEAYIVKRRYKDALAMEEVFSSIRTKNMINK